MSKINKENKPITSEKLMNEFHRYQKGSITRRHFLEVTGLGTAMTTRAFYDTEAAKHLSACFQAIDDTRFNNIIADTKARISRLAQEASLHGIFHTKVCEYFKALSDTYRTPRLRLLIKVHKDPISSRPITAGTQWLTNPLAVFLANRLQPLPFR